MFLAVDFEEGFSNAWSRIATFVPKLIGFLVILVIGYFVAKAISRIVSALLKRVGFDRVIERGGVGQALERSRFDASDILAKIVFWAAFLFVLQLAFGVFGPNPISDLIHGIIAFLPNLFVAVLILVITAALAKALTEVLKAALGAVSGGEMIARVAGMAVLAVGVFAALNQLRIAPAIVNGLFYALLAIVAGSAIVAIGGGGIATMQRYWERSASKLEEQAPQARQQVQGAGDRMRQRTEELRSQAQTQAQTQQTGAQGSRRVQ